MIVWKNKVMLRQANNRTVLKFIKIDMFFLLTFIVLNIKKTISWPVEQEKHLFVVKPTRK